jgi:hypothetical protein
MGKQQEWKQITYLRKVIKCGKTPITKKPNGTICGGVTLTDETIKPYVEKLAALEANMEANKKQALTTQTTTTNIVSAESPPPKRMKITLDNYFRRQQALTTQTTTNNIVSAESPPQKRMKITGGSSHTSDLASLLDINLSKPSDNTINICIHIFETPLVN